MPYDSPQRGDLIFLDCDPQAGHEQSGRRPAVVISNHTFHRHTNGFAVVCPITNTRKPFPLHVPLDSRTKTTGVIMCEQMKSLDLSARNASFQESVPPDILREVFERVLLSIGDES